MKRNPPQGGFLFSFFVVSCAIGSGKQEPASGFEQFHGMSARAQDGDFGGVRSMRSPVRIAFKITSGPSRVSDLERELSKHLVVRLTNSVTAIDICVVHLRRPIGDGGV